MFYGSADDPARHAAVGRSDHHYSTDIVELSVTAVEIITGVVAQCD